MSNKRLDKAEGDQKRPVRREVMTSAHASVLEVVARRRNCNASSKFNRIARHSRWETQIVATFRRPFRHWSSDQPKGNHNAHLRLIVRHLDGRLPGQHKQSVSQLVLTQVENDPH